MCEEEEEEWEATVIRMKRESDVIRRLGKVSH